MATQKVLGILGGGQLAQMMALAAIPLGIKCHIYEPDPLAPARLCAIHHCAPYDDEAALRQFAAAVDVITYEFENVPVDCGTFLRTLKPVAPGIAALRICQDRLLEKTFARDLGFTTAPFVDLVASLTSADAIAAVGLPAILKTRRLGYDGKGQQTVHTIAELDTARACYEGHPLILEGFVTFAHEVSIIAARAADGTTVRFPLIQNTHHHGILRTAVAPAPCSTKGLEQDADRMMQTVMHAFGYIGVLSIECFVVETTQGPTLVINEFAPRVHNSGHWSIEGARTSQFAYHVRAVTGLILPDVTLHGVAAMCNLIGDEPDDSEIPPDVFVHRYHKAPRPRRKVGHLTMVSSTHDNVTHLLQHCAQLLGVKIS